MLISLADLRLCFRICGCYIVASGAVTSQHDIVENVTIWGEGGGRTVNVHLNNVKKKKRKRKKIR